MKTMIQIIELIANVFEEENIEVCKPFQLRDRLNGTYCINSVHTFKYEHMDYGCLKCGKIDCIAKSCIECGNAFCKSRRKSSIRCKFI